MQDITYQIEDLELQTESEPDTLQDEMTFVEWLKACSNDELQKRLNIRKQQDIIGKFIQSEPKIQPVKYALHDAKDFVQEDKDKPSQNTTFIVSETLAGIYRQQRKYDLAIDAYRKLCLLYPEKNVYFAALIKQIEKESDKA